MRLDELDWRNPYNADVNKRIADVTFRGIKIRVVERLTGLYFFNAGIYGVWQDLEPLTAQCLLCAFEQGVENVSSM